MLVINYLQRSKAGPIMGPYQKRWGSWYTPVIDWCLCRRALVTSGSQSARPASSFVMPEKLFCGLRGIICSRKSRALAISSTELPWGPGWPCSCELLPIRADTAVVSPPTKSWTSWRYMSTATRRKPSSMIVAASSK